MKERHWTITEEYRGHYARLAEITTTKTEALLYLAMWVHGGLTLKQAMHQTGVSDRAFHRAAGALLARGVVQWKEIEPEPKEADLTPNN